MTSKEKAKHIREYEELLNNPELDAIHKTALNIKIRVLKEYIAKFDASQEAEYAIKTSDFARVIAIIEDDSLFVVKLNSTDKERSDWKMWEAILNPNYELTQSLLGTNKSVRRTNFWSPFFAGLAALMAILTFLFQLQDKPRLQKIELLQQQTKVLDSVSRIHQTLLDSLARAKKEAEKNPDSAKPKSPTGINQ